MPGPQPDVPPIGVARSAVRCDFAGGTLLVALNTVLRSQPRFVFSIPYSAAVGALITPGGKCTPLMKRTVRDESGAMLWLKNAAVRATPTARSSFARIGVGLVEERQHASGAIDDGDRGASPPSRGVAPP